jgi:hypothetical protein
MNAIFCSGTQTDIAIHNTAISLEDRYATAPLRSVLPRQQSVDEDSLHASFDAALSDRVLALNNHWNSRSSLHTPAYTTNALWHSRPSVSTEPLTSCASHSTHVWPQRIMYSCLALMLLLIGFDLMGLLVLHTH